MMRTVLIFLVAIIVVSFCENIMYSLTTILTGQEDFSNIGYFIIAVIVDFNIFSIIFKYYLPDNYL